jgi:transcriptional regulator with XRE-family HTH domain
MNKQRDIAATLAILMDRDSRVSGSQQELSRLTGVDQSVISRILKRTVTSPRDMTVAPLARFFGVTLAQLKGYDALDHETGVRESGPLLTDEQQTLLRLYGDLTPAQRHAVLNMLEQFHASLHAGKKPAGASYMDMQRDGKGRKR